MTPKWYQIAVDEIGVAEIPGEDHNDTIIKYHSETGLKAQEDEVPWCGAFVAWVMRKAGINYDSVWARAAGARQWLDWGQKLEEPIIGCVVIQARGTDGVSGHVSFFGGWVNKSKGIWRSLGGNQSDRVNIAQYSSKRVLGYRWPKEKPIPAGNQKLSKSGVMQGAGAAAVGTVAAVAENTQQIVGGLNDAETQASSGTIFGYVAAAVICVGIVWIIVSRVRGKNSEKELEDG